MSKYISQTLVILILSVALANSSNLPYADSYLEEEEEKGVNSTFTVDFFPPLFALAGSLGSEWLFSPEYGFGLWGTTEFSYGKNLITSSQNNGYALSLGLTWHPSKTLHSGALYARFYFARIEIELPDSDNNFYPVRYHSQQLRIGFLKRSIFWQKLGYYYNLGLGYPVGKIHVEWVKNQPKQNPEQLLNLFRYFSYLDLNGGLYFYF
jgi:hypothetical protein